MNAQGDPRLIGAPRDRVDGRLKVTGGATYSAEWPQTNLAYGFLVLSTIAAGRIAQIDTAAARAHRGVIAVMTPDNAPRVNANGPTPNDRNLMVLQDDIVRYDRQPVAVVIADSFEAAKFGASLVAVDYRTAKPMTELQHGEPLAVTQILDEPANTFRGDARTALAQAPLRIDNVYTTPQENHNPMEPHATIARWDGDRLTLYDANQGVFPARKRLAYTFDVPETHVRVITKFVGGAFGCKGSQWPHTILAAMAAKLVGRPVRIELWRPQMWGSIGYRPPTVQRVALGAGHDGVLTSQIHEVVSQTSTFDEFIEPSGLLTTMLYASPTLRVTHELKRLNVGTPTYMRAPGESSGSFALESAMDELAYAAGLDPVELRLRNYAHEDPTKRIPFSSKSLRECYAAGAAAFDWQRRTSAPRSMRDGRSLIGLGMATAVYPTHRSAAAATARIDADGSAVVRSGGVEIGTGAYTVFTQVAAEALGIPVERVLFELGDSTFPDAPVAGGSQLTASVGSAVKLAALDTRARVAARAVADPASPLHGLPIASLDARDGRLFARDQPSRGETYAAILARSGGAVEGRSDAAPAADAQRYSMHAFGAQFAEVRVDPDLGEVRLVRQLGAFAAGRILNAKTARSQFLGGMVFGAGMALLEQTRSDRRTGRIMTANLAEYLVPVNADIGAVDVVLVPEDDPHVNEIGVKGIGEIGIVGAAAAIANAVYHATGTRVRDLPITPDKLLA
ncbi:MAG: xanthine dehydrogenase family protein molybdopterin-binding subunit [Candidatus Velthaea sp.]|jgi:xanthine dehydrogenase YagR molybdenum-binding subunit